jgi:prepilin-type processing-associated H-X9-DG protein
MVLGHSGEGVGPGSNRSEPNQFYSLHAGRGVNFLFADGHVAYLKATMDYKTYVALSTRNRGEVVGDDYGLKDEVPMRRCSAIFVLALSTFGCGDDDDYAEGPKTPIPLDQVPAVVLQAAKRAAPDLSFFAAYKDKFDGQESIEIRGKTKSGKIKEIEVSPDGKVLGTE